MMPSRRSTMLHARCNWLQRSSLTCTPSFAHPPHMTGCLSWSIPKLPSLHHAVQMDGLKDEGERRAVNEDSPNQSRSVGASLLRRNPGQMSTGAGGGYQKTER